MTRHQMNPEMPGFICYSESARLAAWTEQLKLEHRSILWQRGFTKLPPVTISIVKANSLWGSWSAATRILSIKEDLILNKDWPTVTGILTHEIAHQLVSDLFPQAEANEPPHGPTFNRMAEKLNLHPSYRKSTVDLSYSGIPKSPYAREDLTQAPDPMLNKVKKILALTSSPQANEAAAALAAAGRIMNRYNLEQLSDTGTEEKKFDRILVSLNKAKKDSRICQICQLLEKHFFVYVIHDSLYDPMVNYTKASIEILGRPSNILMAEHVFHYLMERTESLWERHKPIARMHGEKGIGARNTFFANLLDSFDKKLVKNAPKDERGRPQTAEIILSADQGLKNYRRLCFPKISHFSNSGGRLHAPHSAEAGRQAGENLTIAPPINHAPGQRGLLGLINQK